MSDTDTRPLPTDLGALRQHWLPGAPTDTQLPAPPRRWPSINTAIRSVTAMLADLDRADKDNAIARRRVDARPYRRGGARRRWVTTNIG